MRIRSVLVPILGSASLAAAQPAPSDSDPPPPAPAPAPSALPPITINITNNNTGNNSNTNTQTNTAPVTVSTPVTTTIAAPGVVAPVVAPRSMVERYELHHRVASQRWLMLGVTEHPHGESGVRASLDLFSRAHLAVGIGAELDGVGGRHGGFGGGRDRGGERRRGDGTSGASGDAYLAWTGALGPLDVRAQVGIAIGPGGQRREHLGMRGHDRGGAADLAPRAEAALLVGLPLGHQLGIVAGPMITAGQGDRADVTAFAGLRYRL